MNTSKLIGSLFELQAKIWCGVSVIESTDHARELTQDDLHCLQYLFSDLHDDLKAIMDGLNASRSEVRSELTDAELSKLKRGLKQMHRQINDLVDLADVAPRERPAHIPIEDVLGRSTSAVGGFGGRA